jgi:hypothetical protein
MTVPAANHPHRVNRHLRDADLELAAQLATSRHHSRHPGRGAHVISQNVVIFGVNLLASPLSY